MTQHDQAQLHLSPSHPVAVYGQNSEALQLRTRGRNR